MPQIRKEDICLDLKLNKFLVQSVIVKANIISSKKKKTLLY